MFITNLMISKVPDLMSLLFWKYHQCSQHTQSALKYTIFASFAPANFDFVWTQTNKLYIYIWFFSHFNHTVFVYHVNKYVCVECSRSRACPRCCAGDPGPTKASRRTFTPAWTAATLFKDDQTGVRHRIRSPRLAGILRCLIIKCSFVWSCIRDEPRVQSGPAGCFHIITNTPSEWRRRREIRTRVMLLWRVGVTYRSAYEYQKVEPQTRVHEKPKTGSRRV